MRLVSLDCTQVGHWTAPLQLHLSPRITVVLGDNEAGKSTLRRALRALLFGPDKALVAPLSVAGFDMSAHLQVGGTETCSLYRKGRNLQLPLSERSEALLGAANAGRFSSLFDLTHENLSPQDQTFLKADGALGSLMFGARTGVSPAKLQQARQHIEAALSEVESARRGSDGLPHYQKQLLEAERRHDAVARFGENDALHAQHQTCVAKVAQLESKLGQLDTEAGWLHGLIDGAAEVQQLAQARQAREALVSQGVPPPLARVAEFDQRMSRMEEQAHALADARGALENALAELNASETPGELHTLVAQCEALRDVVASHKADGKVQEQARQRLAGRRAEVEQLLARMGSAGGHDPLATARALLRPEHVVAQLRELVSRREELHRTLQQKNELFSAAQRRLQSIEVEDTDHAATTVDALDDALPRLELASEAEQEIARLATACAKALETLRDQQSALCLAFDVGDPNSVRPPTAESASQAEQALVAAMQQHAAAKSQWERRNSELIRLQKQLAERRVQIGSVASTEDVVQARALRDARLESLCAALDSQEGTLPAPPLVAQAVELRTLVRHSDLLVDRRMEVGEALGQLRAGEQQAEESARECGNYLKEVAAAEVEVAAAREGVCALWPFLTQPPTSSAVWLAQYEAWRRAAQAVRQIEQELAKQRDILAVARGDALAMLGGRLPQLEALASAKALRDTVVRERETRRLRAERIETLREQRREAGLAVAAAKDATSEVTHALADWQAQWDAATTRGLPDGLAREPAAIGSWLALQDALRAALCETDSLATEIETRGKLLADRRQRIDGLVANAQALAPALHLPPRLEPEAAYALVDEACKASASRLAYRQSLERDHAQAVRQAELAHASHSATQSELLNEWAAAGITGTCSRDTLEAIAERSRQLDALDRQIANVEASLKGRWGSQLPAAIAELETNGVSVLEARCCEVATAREETRRERERAADARRDASQALEAMQQGHDAAAVAQALSDAREALFDKIEERLRLQVAKLILERAQRDASDGGEGLQDVASGYFRTLTGGVYSGLRISDDDAGTPELVAVESGRREKSLAELSVGTRDQVWLALRLSGVVAAAKETPFPLLLDDSLVQFDNERAKAALAVLHKVSEHVQVLLLTHHDHLAALAEAVVPGDDLSIVVLPGVSGEMRDRASQGAAKFRPRPQPPARRESDSDSLVLEEGGGPAFPLHGSRFLRRESRAASIEEARQLILQVLARAERPLGKADVLEAASETACEIESVWNEAVRSLLAERRVIKSGEKRGARYALAESRG